MHERVIKSALKLLPVSFLLLVCLSCTTTPTASPLKSDESVVLFPTDAYFDDDAKKWMLNIHAWVFETEPDSLWRNGFVNSLTAFIGEEISPQEKQRLDQRLRWFLVDNERGKLLKVAIEDDRIMLPKSLSNGHVKFLQPYGDHAAAECSDQLQVQVEDGNSLREISGVVYCVEERGVSVISDVDDTVKVTHSYDKKAMLRNVFFSEYEAVEGMAGVYREWQELGWRFHYLSGSPWQLFPLLDELFDQEGFPSGAFYLRHLRMKDDFIRFFFESTEVHKLEVLRRLFESYPQRQFVLIGDSYDKDPEVYTQMAKEYPEQVKHVFIRQDHRNNGNEARVSRVFAHFDPKLWTLYESAEKLKGFH